MSIAAVIANLRDVQVEDNTTMLMKGSRTFTLPGLPQPIRIEQSFLGCEGTGGGVWEGSLVLALWLCERRDELLGGPEPRTVLELGTGTGLVSIVAALLGMPCVVATDCDVDSMRLCSGNAARNGVPEGSLHVLPLGWGDSEESRGQAVTALGRLDNGGHCASIIVFSDVLYDSRNFDALESTLRQCIALGGSEWLVASWKDREQGEEDFIRRFSDLGDVQIVWRGGENDRLNLATVQLQRIVAKESSEQLN